MAGSYTRWYRVGMVTTTLNSKSIVGTNTYWLSAGINPGDLFTTTDGKNFIEILSIEDDTHLTLATPYPYDSSALYHYAICRNFTAHMSSQIAAQTSELVSDMARYWDEDKLTLRGESAYEIAKRLGKTVAGEASWINSLKGDSAYTVAKSNGFTGTEKEWLASLVGKSAYEVAVAGGYTGTQAQWLESLKAAGEWSSANTRITDLESRATAIEDVNTSQATSLANLVKKTNGIPIGSDSWNIRPGHNAFFRGSNLGRFTQAHSDAIQSGTFENMYIGDYFTSEDGSYVWRIVAFDWYFILRDDWGPAHKHHLVLLWERADSGTYMRAQFNDTNDTSGGYYNSYWRKTVKPQLEEQFAADFIDDSHLWRHYERLSSAHNGSGVSGMVTVTDACVELPDERQIDGTRLFITHENLASIWTQPYLRQFPYFQHIMHHAGMLTRTIASATHVIVCADYGTNILEASYNTLCHPIITVR